MKQRTETHCPLFLKFPLGNQPRYQSGYKVLHTLNRKNKNLTIDQQIVGASLNSFSLPKNSENSYKSKRRGERETFFFFFFALSMKERL